MYKTKGLYRYHYSQCLDFLWIRLSRSEQNSSRPSTPAYYIYRSILCLCCLVNKGDEITVLFVAVTHSYANGEWDNFEINEADSFEGINWCLTTLWHCLLAFVAGTTHVTEDDRKIRVGMLNFYCKSKKNTSKRYN